MLSGARQQLLSAISPTDHTNAPFSIGSEPPESSGIFRPGGVVAHHPNFVDAVAAAIKVYTDQRLAE